MELSFLTGIVGDLLATIIYDAGHRRFDGFNNMLRDAFEETRLHFLKEKDIELSQREFEAILAGPVGLQQLEKFRRGDRFLDGNELAVEFVRIGGLYLGDESEELTIAREILGDFLGRLQQHMLDDPKSSVRLLLTYLKAIRDDRKILDAVHDQGRQTLKAVHKGRLEARQGFARIEKGLEDRFLATAAADTAVMRGSARHAAKLVPWVRRWLPLKIARQARIEGEAAPADLKARTPVIVTFGGGPSQGWHDPTVKSFAIWDAQRNTAYNVSPTLPGDDEHSNGRKLQGSSTRWRGRPLCIPSYDVAVEWRLGSYCTSSPWGDVKEKVVQSFLNRCRGRQLECQVVSVTAKGDGWSVQIQSTDYDDFLDMEWAYYRGLESALARGQYYKSKAIQSSEPGNLRRFAEKLAKNPRFRELIPKQYSDHFKERPLKGSDVFLMLTGIIEREKGVKFPQGTG